MTFIQIWGTPTNSDATTTQTQSGPATTSGNLLIAAIHVRGSSLPPTSSVTLSDDSGTNMWTLIQSQQAGSANLFMFYCADADSITSITATWTETATAAVILLSEHSGIGPLVASDVEILPSGGGIPANRLTATGANQLLVAGWGTASSNRTWEIAGEGVTPTQAGFFQGQQQSLASAYAYTTAAGDVAVGYNQTGGTATGSVVVNALFDVDSGGGPEYPGMAYRLVGGNYVEQEFVLE